MGLQQRDNVTATDLDNKPRPLAGFTILQMIGLLAGLLLAAGAWSLLPPIRDITGDGRTLLIVHVMLTTSVFALVAFVVIAADADGAEPFARHYWAYLTRRRRYAPRPKTGQQGATSGRPRAAATGNRTTILACGAITLVLITVTGLDLILVGGAVAAPPRTLLDCCDLDLRVVHLAGGQRKSLAHLMLLDGRAAIIAMLSLR